MLFWTAALSTANQVQSLQCMHAHTRRCGFARLYYRAGALHEAGQKHSIPLIKPGCVCHAMTL